MITWGTVSVKDIVELGIIVGGLLWQLALINARLLVLEKLVQMLVLRSGMTHSQGDE